MAARQCGICKLALREDDSWNLVRLKEGDKPETEIGLYHACSDCAEEHRQRIAKVRPLMKTVRVTNPDGSVSKKTVPKLADELSEADCA